MRTPFRFRHWPLAAAPLLLAVSCQPHANVVPSPGGGFRPVECGTGSGASDSAVIGPAGGRVAVRGHSLTVPPGAVARMVTFHITEHPGRYLKVDVQPEGTSFADSATLTLSYARCGGKPAGFGALSVAQVDPRTNDVLQTFPSVTDTTARTVSTPALRHLSGYLLGGN